MCRKIVVQLIGGEGMTQSMAPSFMQLLVAGTVIPSTQGLGFEDQCSSVTLFIQPFDLGKECDESSPHIWLYALEEVSMRFQRDKTTFASLFNTCIRLHRSLSTIDDLSTVECRQSLY